MKPELICRAHLTQTIGLFPWETGKLPDRFNTDHLRAIENGLDHGLAFVPRLFNGEFIRPVNRSR